MNIKYLITIMAVSLSFFSGSFLYANENEKDCTIRVWTTRAGHVSLQTDNSFINPWSKTQEGKVSGVPIEKAEYFPNINEDETMLGTPDHTFNIKISVRESERIGRDWTTFKENLSNPHGSVGITVK